MSKAAVMISAVIYLALLLHSAFAQTSAEKITQGANILVTLVNQEPDPVQPADMVDVRFKIENIGGKEAANVEFEIVPEFPFSLRPGANALTQLGLLQSRQVDAEGVIVKYALLVDENAVEGDKKLKVRYRIDNGGWVLLEDFMIDIRTEDAILSLDKVSTDKKSLEPGSTSSITLTLSNEGDSALRSVLVKLGLDSSFVPIGSGDERTIYQIPARKKQDVTFSLMVNPQASAGVYKIPLTLSYFDEVGSKFIRNNTIGLIVGSEPDISITVDDTTLHQSARMGEVSIKVVNKGVSDIKFANLKLIPTEKIRLLSNPEIYLGNIDSDDFESATFDLFVEKSSQTKVALPIQLEYKDANNNDFVKKIDLTLDLYSSADAKKFGFEKGSGAMGIVLVIVIVVVGVFLFRRYWKRRKH